MKDFLQTLLFSLPIGHSSGMRVEYTKKLRLKMDPVALTQDLLRCPSVTPIDAGAIDVLVRRVEIARISLS